MHLFERFMFRRSEFVSALLNESRERTSSSAESVDIEEWKDRINMTTIDHKFTDELVLDFLLHENHKKAADRFQADTGLTSQKAEQLELKQRVSSHVKNLEIDKLFEFFSQLSKERLELDHSFKAELSLLKLYGLIKSGHNTLALCYCKDEVQVLIKGKKNLEKLTDLILSTMVWTRTDQEFPYIEEINILIEEVNDKAIDWINQHLNFSKDSQLVNLVRQIRWMEDRLGKRKPLPRLDEIGDGVFHLAGDRPVRSFFS